MTAKIKFVRRFKVVHAYRGRKAGGALGVLLALAGLSLLFFKSWAHRKHLNGSYGLVNGGDTLHMALLIAGLLLAGAGITLVLRATFGRWRTVD